ncbi:MAG: phytoene desaturase family protein [Parachlamydiaceae bacterium]
MQKDAIVVGSGPNGFAAAITLAQAGLSVALIESKETLGGGMRSQELTLPGFLHDVCSAVHPLGKGSPFFNQLNLSSFGLEWVEPPIPLAHPLEGSDAVVLESSLAKTVEELGADGSSYADLIGPLASQWDELAQDILSPLRWPKHPLAMLRFAFYALQPATKLTKKIFTEARTKSLFAGLAAHSILPLEQPLTSAFGIILGALAHHGGWPFPKGGSKSLVDALTKCLGSLGGEIVTGLTIERLDQLRNAKVILMDVTPHQLLRIMGDSFPKSYQQQLQTYRYGPGIFKVDWALSSPIPWKHKQCGEAGTIHLGGSEEEIALSQNEIWDNKCSKKPYIILSQPSLFDKSRAPAGKHTAWGYCHVPHGSTVNMTDVIENQIERWAPGFKDCILAKSSKNSQDMEIYNPNYVGGDISGGVQDLYQLFTRPTRRIVPYTTPVENVFICSSSTPPGGGVHGMCGFHAASAALKYLSYKFKK